MILSPLLKVQQTIHFVVLQSFHRSAVEQDPSDISHAPYVENSTRSSWLVVHFTHSIPNQECKLFERLMHHLLLK